MSYLTCLFFLCRCPGCPICPDGYDNHDDDDDNDDPDDHHYSDDHDHDVHGDHDDRGVYSSVYQYISIYKKLPFLADFIKKNWVHFIKISDFLLKNDQIWPEIAISDHKKLNASKQ